MAKQVAPGPGATCQPDGRRARKGTPLLPPLPPHVIEDPLQDVDLMKVRDWLMKLPLTTLFTDALEDAVLYVLDGAHTGRFYLNDPEVDSDERSSVGTKAQYRILGALKLPKMPPLDTQIAGVFVDIKTTIGGTWMIPREAQCEVCLLVQIDAARDRHRAFVMRTHRVWLNAGNQDSKRSVMADARNRFGLPLFTDWQPLPRNPLRDLTPAQRDVVFAPRVGQVRRLVALFGYLPGTVIPRHAILTVCANRADPLRRVREVKQQVQLKHGLKLLCGTWKTDRQEAKTAGYDLGESDWLALAPPHLRSSPSPNVVAP